MRYLVTWECLVEEESEAEVRDKVVRQFQSQIPISTFSVHALPHVPTRDELEKRLPYHWSPGWFHWYTRKSIYVAMSLMMLVPLLLGVVWWGLKGMVAGMATEIKEVRRNLSMTVAVVSMRRPKGRAK